MRFWILILFTLSLDAKILEVKQLFNFSTISVKKEILAQTQTYYGRTGVDESKVHDIALRFDAYVTRLFANKRYMKIKKGDMLFKLYSKEVISALEEFRLSSHISKSAKRNALLKLKLLDLPNLDKRATMQESFVYTSPVTGYVIAKNIQEGSFAKRGKVLLQIADFSTIWVIANVYQKDIAFVHKGMKAKIKTQGFPPQEGVIDQVYPTVDAKNQTIPVRIVIKNNTNLFPGLFSKIKITKNSAPRLILPKTAIIQKGEKSYVFIPQSDGSFTPKEIHVTQINSQNFAIHSGLKEGDKVVDKALFLLDSDAMTNGLYDEEEDDDW